MSDYNDPWTFDAKSGQIRDADGWALATVPHAIAGGPDDLRNGRLMAEAPELAEVLSLLLAAIKTNSSRHALEEGYIDRAERVLAKVAGID